ncbi:hypothetical protein CCH79_00013233 [Gambusia affinis]|uniref:Nitric oxide synthase-interacting protein n=1 Tax=Gambusia affinis TaxID=33528 RepID=A0A315V523_GAMAF|nr:hypothetical protein CCH79_00013233 [Gambusia affinis]
MGKRQHQKDKMYITCTEYTNFYGGKRAEIPRSNFKRLPFDHCSLSLQPFEYPVCTEEGVVFDLLSIVPWIKKYGTNPISGEKLEAKSLIKLNFAKNNDGKYHCPVLYNVFTNNSHIVAIKVTGNVFSYEAVEQLNIKTKSYKDLLTDEPFTRKDIIMLQDPTNLDKFNVSSFFHVKNNLKVLDPDEEKAKQDPAYHLKSTNLETRETLAELYKEYKGDQLLASTMKEPEAKKTDKINAVSKHKTLDSVDARNALCIHLNSTRVHVNMYVFRLTLLLRVAMMGEQEQALQEIWLPTGEGIRFPEVSSLQMEHKRSADISQESIKGLVYVSGERNQQPKIKSPIAQINHWVGQKLKGQPLAKQKSNNTTTIQPPKRNR